jgi:hypothetical protein
MNPTHPLDRDTLIAFYRTMRLIRRDAVLLENVLRFPALERVFLQMALRDREIGELRRRVEEVCCAQLAALTMEVCPRDQVPDPDASA